jgi:hypothetical protein
MAANIDASSMGRSVGAGRPGGGTPDPAPGRDGLLRVTREQVADVAASWSFSNTALLTDAMRRLLGIGPTAYRAATQRRSPIGSPASFAYVTGLAYLSTLTIRPPRNTKRKT